MRGRFGIMPAFLAQGLWQHGAEIPVMLPVWAGWGIDFYRTLTYYPFLSIEEANRKGILIPWKTKNGKYDLSKLNPAYFKALNYLFEESKKYNLHPIISIADFAQVRHPQHFRHSPWNPRNNLQGATFKTAWRWQVQLTKKIIKLARKHFGDEFYIELSNEPTFLEVREWMANMWKGLKKHIHPKQIIVNAPLLLLRRCLEVFKSNEVIPSIHLAHMWSFKHDADLQQLFQKRWFLRYNKIMISTDGMRESKHMAPQALQDLFMEFWRWGKRRGKEILAEHQPPEMWQGVDEQGWHEKIFDLLYDPTFEKKMKAIAAGYNKVYGRPLPNFGKYKNPANALKLPLPWWKRLIRFFTGRSGDGKPV